MASATGRGERTVLRLSGPRSAQIVSGLCQPESAGADPLKCDAASDGSRVDLSGRGVHDVLFDDGTGLLPGRLLWMPGPRSFTAEDVAELHLPGHPELISGVLERLLGAGATLAEPGEFTRRAFENGRIDLTQAEGVAALVAARSEGERRAATALLVGGLERRVRAIRGELEAVRSLSEASLDFDEADTGHVPTESLVAMGESALVRIQEALGWERQRSASDRVPSVVLAGEPNAGKSTLFNRLVGEAGALHSGHAIVSDLSGTTRDAKRGEWRLGDGVEVALFDTAGLGLSAPRDNEPDRLAAKRAVELIETADLVLWVLDASMPAPPAPPTGVDLADEGTRLLRVLNKADLEGVPASRGALRISASTGAGLDLLEAACGKALGLHGPVAASPEAVLFMATAGTHWGLGPRHLSALEAAALRVGGALEAVAVGVPLDLVSEDLKLATDHLDEIAGRTVPEDLLDRIFAQFCLGK